MKKYLWLFCLMITGCKQLLQQRGTSGLNLTVKYGDSALQLQNGILFYGRQPFSGIMETFFETGRTRSKQSFREGKEEGWLYTWYENGRPATQRFFHNGEKDGVSRGWWANGKNSFEYHFRNGSYEGDFREWYENGRPLKHIVYRNGKEEWGKGWRNNGKPYMSFVVKNGRYYGLINPNLCYSVRNEQKPSL